MYLLPRFTNFQYFSLYTFLYSHILFDFVGPLKGPLEIADMMSLYSLIVQYGS